MRRDPLAWLTHQYSQSTRKVLRNGWVGFYCLLQLLSTALAVLVAKYDVRMMMMWLLMPRLLQLLRLMQGKDAAPAGIPAAAAAATDDDDDATAAADADATAHCSGK